MRIMDFSQYYLPLVVFDTDNTLHTILTSLTHLIESVKTDEQMRTDAFYMIDGCFEIIHNAVEMKQQDASASLHAQRLLLIDLVDGLCDCFKGVTDDSKNSIFSDIQKVLQMLKIFIDHSVLFSIYLGLEGAEKIKNNAVAFKRLEIVSSPTYIPDDLLREAFEIIGFISAEDDTQSLIALRVFFEKLKAQTVLLTENLSEMVLLYENALSQLAMHGELSLVGLLAYLYMQTIAYAEKHHHAESIAFEKNSMMRACRHKRYADIALTESAWTFYSDCPPATNKMDLSQVPLETMPVIPKETLDPSIEALWSKLQSAIAYLKVFRGDFGRCSAITLENRIKDLLYSPMSCLDKMILIKDAMQSWLKKSMHLHGVGDRLSDQVLTLSALIVSRLKEQHYKKI